MPLTPELRNLRDANGDLIYRGPVYKARRERLLQRAGDKCERCGVVNHHVVRRAYLNSWKDGDHWYSPEGLPPRAWLKIRTVRIVLTMAHLTHDPLRNEDDELAMLCQWCHLNHDKRHHKETRCTRKDAARPLLVSAEIPVRGEGAPPKPEPDEGRRSPGWKSTDPWPAFAAAYGLETAGATAKEGTA